MLHRYPLHREDFGMKIVSQISNSIRRCSRCQIWIAFFGFGPSSCMSTFHEAQRLTKFTKLPERGQRMISKGCVRPNFHRWSLQALAESTKVSSSTSLFLLDCIVSRLEYQHDVIQDLLRWSSQEGDQKHAIRGLETLAYIHKDTCRLGKDLLEHQTIWKRSSTADRHLVHSTFLEIRARHANTVEASVEVLGHWREQLHQEQAGGGETLASSPSQTEHLEQYILLHESIEDFLRRRLGIHSCVIITSNCTSDRAVSSRWTLRSNRLSSRQ